jgi:hypothetical protein
MIAKRQFRKSLRARRLPADRALGRDHLCNRLVVEASVEAMGEELLKRPLSAMALLRG